MRRSAGDAVSEDEFIKRFPHFSTVVREEFQISTVIQASMVEDTQTFRPILKSIKLPTVSRLGDYVLNGELGRGAMGAVFAARHLKHGTQVALKTLPTVGARELQRFKQEFRALADVNHRNLVGLHTLQEEAGQWFFTMDLVDGEDFLSYVRPGGLLDEQRLRNALAQLAAGVQALHSRNIVHRDLKPNNVLVDRDGRVLLLDFGVVLDLATPGDENEAAGTPAFMAPEQFSEKTTTAASDWYAVGVMIHNALTDDLPFSGSLGEIFKAKQTQAPPPLPDDSPVDLAELSLRLMARDPLDRPDTDEVLRLLAAEIDVGSTAKDEIDVPLTGRDAQVEQLQQAVDAFVSGETARTVFISGRSGEGKTLLAEHFLKRFREDDDYTVLSGRCYDRESVPFKAVDSLIDALTAFLRSLPDNAVPSLLTPDVAVLAELFPVLDRVPAIAKLPRLPLDDLELDRVRRFAAAGLRAIVQGLSQRTTLILFIDDLHWGDADSADFLMNVIQPPDSQRVLFLGTYRSDEADDSRFLQEWAEERNRLPEELPHDDCKLAPLDEEECVRLVLEITGVDNDSMRRRAKEIARETGGNPFLLTELVSCLDPDNATTAPMQIDEVVERKLSQLPADARALLDVVSVSGQALAIDEAAKTVGHAEVPLATMTRMRTERLLRLVGEESSMTVDTYHDRIRETVLREMDSDEKRGLHVRLAEQILMTSPEVSANGDEPTTNPRVYDLAYHFFEGGDPRGFDYQLQAGESAMRVYALEDSLNYLKRAEERLPENATEATRYRLWERLGDVCGRTKRPSEGLEYYRKAAPFASTAIERAKSHDGIGEMFHRMGKSDAAVASFDDGLHELGYSRPTWIPRVLASSTWYLGFCQLGSWIVRPHWREESRRKAALASAIYHRIAQTLIMAGDMLRYGDASARQVYTALRSGNPDTIGAGYAKLGYNTAAFSFSFFSRRMFRRSKTFIEESQDPRTRGMVDGLLGAAEITYGEFEQGESTTRRALDALERHGELWYCAMYHHMLRHALSDQGQSEKALIEAEIEHRMAVAVADKETICWGQYGMSDCKARMGNLKEAHAHIRRAWAVFDGTRGKLTESILTQHEAYVRLQSSDYLFAHEILQRSKRVLEKNLCYIVYCVRTYPLLVESLVGPNWRDVRKDRDVKLARRHLRRTRFFAWRFPSLRSHAWRVRGRYYAVTGRLRKAWRCFEKAISEGRRIGVHGDVARALLDLSVIDEERQVQLRDEAVTILKRLKAVIPYAERWQLGDDPDMACVAPDWKPEPLPQA